MAAAPCLPRLDIALNVCRERSMHAHGEPVGTLIVQCKCKALPLFVSWFVRFFIRSFVRPSVRSLARLLGSDYSPTRRRYKITASGRMKLVIFFTAYLVLGIFGTVYSTFGTSTTDAQLYQPCVRTPALTECIPLAINRR